VLATNPMSHHAAMMLPDWGPATFFPQDHALEPETRAALERRGVAIEPSHVTAVGGDQEGVELQLADGRALRFAGLFLASRTRPAGSLVAQLGCAQEDGPLGPFITTDALKETTVRGVFACGDAAMAVGSLGLAVGDGVRAGVSTHQSLIFR
jgi:thioredoxin reductase